MEFPGATTKKLKNFFYNKKSLNSTFQELIHEIKNLIVLGLVKKNLTK